MLKYPHGSLPRMNVLRAFEAAARHSSYTRTAEELAIQQPAVSRYIAELEHAGSGCSSALAVTCT